MKKRLKKLQFTLIEIVVAFGVLAIMIMFLMQFLTTAQTSWTFAEKRARAYADSRAFWDFVDRALESSTNKDISAIAAGGSTSFSFTGVKPFEGEYLEKIEIAFSDGEVKINGETILENIKEFKVYKNGTALIFVLHMFGSELDYEAYNELSDDDDKKKYFNEHGFIFTRVLDIL